MDPLSTTGALPRRTEDAATSSSTSGVQPRLSGADRARSQQLAALFTAQVEASMMTSLEGLSGEGESEGAEGEGDGLGGLDASAGSSAQLEVLGSLYSASTAQGATVQGLQQQIAAALQQAQAGAQGSGDAASGGGDTVALMAQQLIASFGAAPTAATAVAAPVGASGSARDNALQVADVARRQGVDPTVAVAMMLVESGGNARAVGDGGTSFGLFQLHEGGMLTAAGLTPDQAFDPRTNAGVALKSLAHEWAKGPNRSPGVIAAASQRPFDPAGYARKVDAAMERARALLA
jgi:hypothetical protein